MEAFVLPLLFATIVVMIAYVAIFWLGRKDGRALSHLDDEDRSSSSDESPR